MQHPGIIKFHSRECEYGFLSNVYPVEFTVNNVVYKSAEHYFQSMKFNETAFIRNAILQCKSPKETIRVAAAFRRNADDDWMQKCDAVMADAISYKFKNRKLAEMLLSTKDALLLYTAANDGYWGCGNDGLGDNMLGRLLMEKRESLKKEQIKRDIILGRGL